MGTLRILLAGLLAAGNAVASIEAAEYYFENGNFPLALSLWEPALKKNPRDLKALQRTGELTLLLRGRNAMADLFLESAKEPWPMEARSKMLAVFLELQSRFLTDQAQELYLQALQKRSRKDFTGAVALLAQAANREPGHTLVLRALAQSEWDSRNYEGYFSSLKAAWKSYPFDPHEKLQLAEAYLYFKQYSAALALLKGSSSLGERGLLIRAVCHYEKGDYSDAKSLALSLLSRAPSPTEMAVAYALLAQLSFRSEGHSPLTSKLYSKFLAAGVEIPEFDPFQLKAKRAEAERSIQVTEESVTSRKAKPVLNR